MFDNKSLLIRVIGEGLYEALKNTPQSPKYHSEGNVANHVLLVMEKVDEHVFMNKETYGAAKLAAIIHDLGKMEATRTNDGKITAYNHESLSMQYFDALSIGIVLGNFTAKEIEIAKAMVKDHMRAHLYRDGQMSNPNKRKEFESRPYFKEIMEFSECDSLGSIRS